MTLYEYDIGVFDILHTTYVLDNAWRLRPFPFRIIAHLLPLVDQVNWARDCFLHSLAIE